MQETAQFGSVLEVAQFGTGLEEALFGEMSSSGEYTVCSLTIINSYQSTQFAASTVCPLGRDWGTKRYTADGKILGNYIHDEFPDD